MHSKAHCLPWITQQFHLCVTKCENAPQCLLHIIVFVVDCNTTRLCTIIALFIQNEVKIIQLQSDLYGPLIRCYVYDTNINIVYVFADNRTLIDYAELRETTARSKITSIDNREERKNNTLHKAAKPIDRFTVKNKYMYVLLA